MSVETSLEFERKCGICFGRCAWMAGDTCENCNSTGQVPTELGRKLLEFLEQHQKTTNSSNTRQEAPKR